MYNWHLRKRTTGYFRERGGGGGGRSKERETDRQRNSESDTERERLLTVYLLYFDHRPLSACVRACVCVWGGGGWVGGRGVSGDKYDIQTTKREKKEKKKS